MAIQLNGDDLAPYAIFGNERLRVEDPAVAQKGQRLCVSAAATNRVKCGNVVGIKEQALFSDDFRRGVLRVDGLSTRGGDSGSPVWRAKGGASIGIIVGGTKHGTVSSVQPFLDTPTGRQTTIDGSLDAPEMSGLHILADG